MKNLDSVCYVDRISSVAPINGADKIEQVKVKGWNCVVPKGKYKGGELVVCITQDAVVPKIFAEENGFISYLRHRKKTDQYCVRTVKLRGVYSECVILDIDSVGSIGGYEVGDDLERELGITKYEEPEEVRSVGGKIAKYHNNPHFHIYYKFPNAKNAGDVFTENDIVYITRKIHGSNWRAGIVKKDQITFWDKVKKFFGNKWAEYTFVYGSRTVEKGSDSQGYYSSDVWKTTCDRYSVKERLWKYFKTHPDPDSIKEGIILYGEVYGPGIQGEKYTYGEKEIKLKLFDIKLNAEYLGEKEWRTLALSMGFGTKDMVDILYNGKWSKEEEDKWTFNHFINDTKIPHEGIVVKREDGNRQHIYKRINPEYLIFSEKNNVPEHH
jgi:RNA ligase (TIGR02306 family)